MNIRLDELVLERGLASNLKEAQAIIMSGKVLVKDVVEDKVGTKFDSKISIRVKEKKTPFVSRGGVKLEGAFCSFDISVKNLVCMDVGASTGGFTHLLLLNGAKRVYSVDVGQGLLDWRLRNDERVVVMEKTNIRKVVPKGDMRELDFICVDVSFISLKLILVNLYDLLKKGGRLVTLIKPQFEAKKEEVGSGGIVRDSKVHEKVVSEILEFAENIGFTNLGVEPSKLRGTKGNLEFLAYFERG